MLFFQEPGTKAPTSATRKAEMQDWLRKKGVDFDEKLTKPQLYTIIQREKTFHDKDYRVDRVLSANGHQILRLPPYHCDLNPIELIWADMKGYVSRNNCSFKVKDVRALIGESISMVNSDKWENACRHVIDIENMYWAKDNIQTQQIAPIIIRLGDDSDDDVDSESDGVSEERSEHSAGEDSD